MKLCKIKTSLLHFVSNWINNKFVCRMQSMCFSWSGIIRMHFDMKRREKDREKKRRKMCNLQIASITFRNFLCLYILIHLLWEVKRQQSEMKAKKLFIWAILTRHICSHTPNANVYRKKRDIAILNKKSKDMQNLSQMAALKVYESASLAKCAKVFFKDSIDDLR